MKMKKPKYQRKLVAVKTKTALVIGVLLVFTCTALTQDH